MKLSIIIPVYGQEEKLRKSLIAICDALEFSPEIEAEILVADDCTPSGAPFALVEQFPLVRLLTAENNLGFGGNVNRAVKQAEGEYLCLLNSDMYIEKDFLRLGIDAFDNPRLFAVCGVIAEPGGVNSGLKNVDMRIDRVRVRFAEEKQNCEDFVLYANGGGSFFRKSLFVELGGFAEVFSPYYWEDTDLGYRACKLGYKIKYCPQLRLEHDHQGTISQEKKRKVQKIRSRNHHLFLWRNFTDISMWQLVIFGIFPLALRHLMQLRFRRFLWLLGDLHYLPSVFCHRRKYRKNIVKSDDQLRNDQWRTI